MKKRTLLSVSALLISAMLFSQSPQAFKYQAVVRDNTGSIIAEQSVDFQIDIVQGTVGGSAIYSETHSSTTNASGMVSLEIGNGTSTDDFSAIGWGMDSYFIKIWVNGNEMGTSQLLSVPYALNAKTAEYTNGLSARANTPCDATTKGAMRYNETSNTVEFCNGSNWTSMASGLSIGLPQLTTVEISEITPNNALSGGTVVSNGGAEIFEKGICWNTTGSPIISENNTKEGSTSEAFNSYLSGLISFETYYLRSYATNTAGTGYGAEVNFKTAPQQASVSTKDATFIDFSSFSTGGATEVSGKETIEERGVAYGINPNPTKIDNFVVSGNGTGEFIVTLTDLAKNLYFFRAYATNEAGISYGTEKSHTKHVESGGNKIMVMPTTSGVVSFVNFNEDSQYSPIATSDSDGQSNTVQLLSRFGSDAQAANMCDTLTAHGYSDWYLPAADELNKLYENKEALGGSITGEVYWSSTEVYNYMYAAALVQEFSSGRQYDQLRSESLSVVCIRKDNE